MAIKTNVVHATRSTLAFFLYQGLSGTFLLSAKQKETFLRVVGDKNKLIPRVSSGTFPLSPSRALRGEHGHRHERGARQAGKACFSLHHGQGRRFLRGVDRKRRFFGLWATKTSVFCLSPVAPPGKLRHTFSREIRVIKTSEGHAEGSALVFSHTANTVEKPCSASTLAIPFAAFSEQNKLILRLSSCTFRINTTHVFAGTYGH